MDHENEIGTGKYALVTDDSGRFWGNMGAGGIFYATKTNRFLLPYRSEEVNEPHTWGVWGGAIDEDETPLDAVKREIKEETAYRGKYKIVPSFIYKNKNFQYHNFIIIVNNEFKPKLCWETESFGWFKIDEFPTPLHFGLKSLLPFLKKEAVLESKAEEFTDTSEEPLNKYDAWVRPNTESLIDEYKREYIKHFRNVFGDLFPSFKDWETAIKQGKVINITPSIRRSIHNTSNAKSVKQIISLIKTYSSYPKFRNESSVEALGKRFIDNLPVFMPLIFEDQDGSLYMVAGDTRLSMTNILHIPAKAVVFKEN